MRLLTLHLTLYKSIGVNKRETLEVDVSNLGRWEKLLENKDDFKIWNAINWKGEYCSDPTKSESFPSDIAFQE